MSGVMGVLCRAVVRGGAGSASASPEFGSSVTLFQPDGADYAHHITGSNPEFGNLTTALLCGAIKISGGNVSIGIGR